MFKIHDTFPKEFLHILLKPGEDPAIQQRSPNDTRRDLVKFLFDTVFYVVCDVVMQIQVITQGAKLFQKDESSDTVSQSAREREAQAIRPREKSQVKSAMVTRRASFNPKS